MDELRRQILKARERGDEVDKVLEEELINIDERRTKIFLHKAQVLASIFLLVLCGCYVVLLPIIGHAIRIVAILNHVAPPQTDWMESLTSVVGVLGILSWGFAGIFPILQIMRNSRPGEIEDLDPDEKE